ncbi:MAG TPA: hypothetical protein VN947_03035 [Polyangia bacterium]|nr:hypothetical protein [Polyangia bacterium]
MRWWSALFLLAGCLAYGGCGRSSLMGSGGVVTLDMAHGGDMACVGANCPSHGDMGDMAGDPCATKDDCKKPECAGDPRCHTPGTEICNNGIDDDDDGLVDCKDPDCASFPGCQPHMCDPNNPDCTDPMCVDNPKCQNLKCMPTVDFGTLMPTGSSSTRMESTTGTTDVAVTPCAPGGGGEVVGEFTLTGSADLTLAWSQQKGEDHVFGLFLAGVNQACGANPIDCVDPKEAQTGLHTFPSLPGGHYYVITQAFEKAGQGPVTVTLSTPSMKEICNNGVDDNGNGLIDCADADCVNDPNCVDQECKPDFNVGALVVNGPSKNVSFDTSAADANNDVSCEGAPGGKDVVVHFVLSEPAGILLRWDQTGDHVVALENMPPPGEACDSDQVDCYDPSGRTQDEVAWGEKPAGEYLFIFKALKPGTEGHIDAQISAYRTRPVELCHNGIDDDGNGLVDCADPACFGVEGCNGPFCMPDVNLGNMSVGEGRTVNLQVSAMGKAGYHTSCAQGGGKGMVVQLSVPAGGTNGGFGLGVDCTQTGDQVLDLFAAGGPRDACDVNELVCADPNTLPFGCGYEIPNLQPGTYNVIAEAFSPSTAGTVNLTLSIIDDRQLEICNNGKDDDGNGLIDCADPKCVTSPFCMSAQCKPDAVIDPVPLDGSTVSKLVQTSGAATQAKPPCESTPGGPTAVIELRFTAKANVSLTWNQLGNHDFALYSETGSGLQCDAGMLVACNPSGNAATGTTTFANVPAGRYWLVVAADSPMSAGSVSVGLSGSPAP